MKVRVEGIAYEGTGLEIMEHLRLRFFPELSDTEDYIQQVRCNFIRAFGYGRCYPAVSTIAIQLDFK